MASPASLAGRLRSGWAGTAATAGVLVVLAWPFVSRPPHNLDRSWEIGLHQAVAGGLRFGPEIVFTYGPLGFLAVPTPFVGPTSALAFLAVAALYAATIAMLLLAARRQFPLWLALLVTLLFARGIGSVFPFEMLQALVFMLGVAALRRDGVDRPVLFAALLGLLAGVALLGKLNAGVAIILMGLVIVLGTSERKARDLAVYGGTFAVTVVVVWLITGQQLADLLPFARGSWEIVSGYSDAMAIDKPERQWVVLAFVPVCMLAAWAGWVASTGWPPRRRIALGMLVVLLFFAVWKHGFVRVHFEVTFAILAMALLVLLPRGLPRSTSLAVLLVAGVAFLGASQVPASRHVDVPRSVIQFARQARNALMPWRWDDATAATRGYLALTFDIPPFVLAEIEGRTVHIDPWQAAVATAYPGLTWRPQPVFQSYSAYTPYLDEVNAGLLRSPDRPARILRRAGERTVDPDRARQVTLDGRLYWFESPAATIERLCRYREAVASDAWQVLEATGRECGPWQPLGSQPATLREIVQVPAAPSPDQLVVVRIHGVDEGLPRRIRSAAWRGAVWRIALDGFTYRFVSATAADGLVLAVPEAAQGSAPFAFGPPVRTISLEERGSGSGGRLNYDFFAVPMPGQ